MPKLVFINLPVSNLARSIAFCEALGATVSPQFSDETAACLVFSDTIHVMLLTHAKFAQFTSLPIADAKSATQVLICLSADSREDVDGTIGRALSAGGVEPRPAQDHGFMFGRSVEDPDGHIYEIMWMDVAAAAGAMAPQPEPAHA